MKICCVCTGNTCRSPMFAALLRQALPKREDISIDSAGVAAAPGMPASEHAVHCMAARGIDISAHRSKPIDHELIRHCDRFLCMGPQHAQRLAAAGASPDRISILCADTGGVPDPFGGDRQIYEHCAASLEAEAARIAASYDEH